MKENKVKNGILYQIEYQKELSTNFYTQRRVYHIKTVNESFFSARHTISHIMEVLLGYKDGNIWSKGLWLIKNQKNPSMENALHVYYEFSYDEDLDVYVYTFVRPYDD